MIIMNGDIRGRGEHFYVCANNKTDAARLVLAAGRLIQFDEVCLPDDSTHREHIERCMAAYDKFDVSRMVRHMKTYWPVGCWGNPMNGIPQERGVWYHDAWNKPVRRII